MIVKLNPRAFCVTPDTQAGLSISHEVATFDEKGQRFTSHFAVPRWQKAGAASPDMSGITVKDVMAATMAKIEYTCTYLEGLTQPSATCKLLKVRESYRLKKLRYTTGWIERVSASWRGVLIWRK